MSSWAQRGRAKWTEDQPEAAEGVCELGPHADPPGPVLGDVAGGDGDPSEGGPPPGMVPQADTAASVELLYHPLRKALVESGVLDLVLGPRADLQHPLALLHPKQGHLDPHPGHLRAGAGSVLLATLCE